MMTEPFKSNTTLDANYQLNLRPEVPAFAVG